MLAGHNGGIIATDAWRVLRCNGRFGSSRSTPLSCGVKAIVFDENRQCGVRPLAGIEAGGLCRGSPAEHANQLHKERRGERDRGGNVGLLQLSKARACWDRPDVRDVRLKSKMPIAFYKNGGQEIRRNSLAEVRKESYEYGFDFKVVVTNKSLQAAGLLDYHDGRGSQEGVFAELKSHCHMEYIPVRTKHGNAVYLLAGLFAYNLTRELQMQTQPQARKTTCNRATLWIFEKVDTLRKTVIQRAGRLSRPNGKLTLTFCAGRSLQKRVVGFLDALSTAA